MKYGYSESGRSLDTGIYGYFDVLGPSIREIYEQSPYVRLNIYKDVGSPNGEFKVEYRTVRKSVKNLSFASDLGNILGNTGLEQTHLSISDTDLLVSKTFLDSMKLYL